MSYLVALDGGHDKSTSGKETPYIKELGRRIKENEFNDAVVKYLKEELKRCGVKTIDVSPEIGVDTPLGTRVARANNAKADIYVSIHFNAHKSTFGASNAEGLSIFHHNGSTKGKRLAESILKHLKGGTKQVNRGVKSANFYVLKNTYMPAVLSENGFMDDEREAMLMINKSFQKEVAIEHAKGICDYFGITYRGDNVAKGYLTVGDSGKDVKQLQEDLIYLGKEYALVYPVTFTKYGADGSFGQGTEQAVRIFQKAFKLVVDGYAGKGTQSKIKELKEKVKALKTKTKILYRVIIDGKQIGAFSDVSNISNQIEKQLGKAKEIKIQKV